MISRAGIRNLLKSVSELAAATEPSAMPNGKTSTVPMSASFHIAGQFNPRFELNIFPRDKAIYFPSIQEYIYDNDSIYLF